MPKCIFLSTYDMKIIPTDIDTELIWSKFLSSLKSIGIQKSVKGNAAVLRNHDDYTKWMVNLISNPAKFQKLSAPEKEDYKFMIYNFKLIYKFIIY